MPDISPVGREKNKKPEAIILYPITEEVLLVRKERKLDDLGERNSE